MWKFMTLTFVSLVSTAPTTLDVNDFAPINQFALRLLDNTYAYVKNDPNKLRQNIAISPLSVWSIFSLLAEGSSGDTFLELMKELRLPRDLRSTQALHLAARNILKCGDKDVLLNGKSVMFSDCSLEIHPEFCKAAITYSTDIYSVDPSNTTKLANDINYFICLATEGRILNVIKPEVLENLRMVLIDALYFKANWTNQFDPAETKVESFYNSQGKRTGSVNMMYQKGNHSFGDATSIEAQVLELTYGRDRQFAMLILLPFDGVSIQTLLKNLATHSLSWMKEYKLSTNVPDVEVYVPRFKMSSQTDLIPPLQYSGIISIFDKQRAQLPGVSNSPLFVSKTIQNVDIEVTESGTVAASATVIGLETRRLGQKFVANKEFVYLIVERCSSAILFAGVYEDPTLF
ncbi:serine protease inhibitor 77Ba-like [Galleria mellonella]|uniref:Serine protease inhibitor 77Ba-like n=1 Tax=Galleria mellonella TaxID=7137 RepID=A0A6J1W757_GALME|nr:serine protease inhibitor 77Ba-like [Galleria mellonella]